MKNLIKKGPKFIRYKANSFKCGDYTLEINGEKYGVKLKNGGLLKETDTVPAYDVNFLNFIRELIKETGSPFNTKIPSGQEYSHYVPGVNICINVPADRFAAGEVVIYHDGERINPDDVLTLEDNWMIDTNKVNLGSIWNLTIDGDPRFQNTMIMITRIWGSSIEFAYQTKVIYSPEYSHVEVAEGLIDFYPNNAEHNFKIEDYLDKIHLTLIKDNTNCGADMDRQNEADVIYPRAYSFGGYREQYPPIPFRERSKHNPDDDYDENDEY